MDESKELRALVETSNFAEEATSPTNTRVKLFGVDLLFAVLFLVILGFVIFFVSDQQEMAEVVDSSVQESNQLSFVQEVHFPNTSVFYIKPDKESTSSFIVRDDKGLSLYDASTGSINSISLYDGVPNLQLGDYTKIGRLVLFDTGEGIGIYDLDTDEIQIYTTQDGLADKSNIRFHPDPYDSNIVWIDTFRGLSRLDLSDRTFQSYTREIGIPGTVWQPKVFYIDQNTVWVTVAANAYNAGGVARLNKNTEVWTAWGTETFVDEGEVNSRVDPVYVSVGSENNIIIEEDDTEYIFDRKKQMWNKLRSFDRAEPTALGLHLNGNWYFYDKQNKLRGYNIVTTENLTVDYTEIFNTVAQTNLPIVNIEYDEIHDRFLLRPWGEAFVKHPYIVTFRIVDGVATDVHLLNFADIYDRYQYVDVEILDVAGNQMVMKTRNRVVLYDLQKHQSVFEFDNKDLLSDGFAIAAKLYPNELAIHVAEYCEGMCLYDSGYQATTTLWNRETGQLELVAPFSSTTSSWSLVWDEASFGVTLHYSYLEGLQSFTLNHTTRAYQETTHHMEFTENRYVDYGEFVPIESSRDVQYVKRNINEDGTILKVKTVESDGTEETHRITLPIVVNAFGVNPGYDVMDAVLREDTAWFLTDRGLIKFNRATKQWNIYNSEDGLIQDAGSRLYIAGEQFIIVTNLGVGIYLYTEN